MTSKAPLPQAPSQRESWAGVAVALFPMLIWPVLLALASLRGKLIQTLNAQATQTAGGVVGGWIFLIAVIILVTVLTAGWVKGWPRWAFPYIGVMLGVSLMLSNSSTPGLVLFGHTFGRSELWGWRAWIPEMVWLAVSLALTRSLRPAWQFVKGIGQDWTRLTFAIYSLLPLALFIVFDETHGEDLFVALLGLLLAAGGLGYLRAKQAGRGFLWMVGAVALVWSAAAVYLGIYWNGRQETWMDRPANGWTTFGAMLGSTAVILVGLCLPAAAAGILRLGAHALNMIRSNLGKPA